DQRVLEVYVPLAQNLALETDRSSPYNRVILIRAHDGTDATIASFARRAVQRALPGASLQIDDMAQMLHSELRPWRLGATLFRIMGLLAAVVAAVGVYSVLSYAVSQRTHEIGVRIALGARLVDICRAIVGDGLGVAVIGVATGAALALALGRFVESLLYGTTT